MSDNTRSLVKQHQRTLVRLRRQLHMPHAVYWHQGRERYDARPEILGGVRSRILDTLQAIMVLRRGATSA